MSTLANHAPIESMALSGSNLQSQQSSSIMSRTIYVNITGSLANLAMAGPAGGSWRIVDGKQNSVFGLGSEVDSQVATNQLRTALIHRVKVTQDRSTFPIALGVHVNCVPPNEITDLGKRYAYTVLPGVVNTVPQTIYQCDVSSEEGLQWRKDYPRWNASNLESEGILNVDNNSWVFVNKDHPIVSLLRHNAGLVGCNIDEQPLIDDEWFKVSRQVVGSCCHTLRTRVLNKVTSNDLNLFQVNLSPLNTDAWDDMNDLNMPLQGLNVSDEATAKKQAEQFLTTPYSYMARIQIDYELQNA